MIIDGKKAFFKGSIKVPGDKSISHRTIMISSIAEGESEIENYLFSDDTQRTIDCFKDMGVNIVSKGNVLTVEGVGLNGLMKPNGPLYCGNSGTTMRLISGILIGQKFSSTIIGDKSLNKRPMNRIIMPLTKMGGNIKGVEEKYPPLKIYPNTNLNGIYYPMPIPSAQVKSAILLASLYSNGETSIEEHGLSRDHTERMLEYYGGDIFVNENIINIKGGAVLKGKKYIVPGDFSSAAFFIVGALTVKNSKINIVDVGLNERRIGLINVLKEMGGNIRVNNLREQCNELIGDIYVKYSKLNGVDISGDTISILVDEIPILAIAASLAEGTTTIRDAQELRYKETDRLNVLSIELKKMGVNIEEIDDGLVIHGRESLKAAVLDSHMDHRIAMALSIGALNGEGKSVIENSDCVSISYPGFYQTMFDNLIFQK